MFDTDTSRYLFRTRLVEFPPNSRDYDRTSAAITNEPRVTFAFSAFEEHLENICRSRSIWRSPLKLLLFVHLARVRAQVRKSENGETLVTYRINSWKFHRATYGIHVLILKGHGREGTRPLPRGFSTVLERISGNIRVSCGRAVDGWARGGCEELADSASPFGKLCWSTCACRTVRETFDLATCWVD